MKSIKKIIRLAAGIYLGFYLISISLGFGIGLSLKSLFASNLVGMGSLLLPIIAIVWLRGNPNKLIGKWVYWAYLIFLIPTVTAIVVVEYLAYNDLLAGNGLQKIYETKIENGKTLSIFRTPDQGALGGDFLDVYLTKDLCCSLELRRKLGRLEQDGNGFTNATFEGKRYRFPSYQQLLEKVRLKNQQSQL